MKLRVAPLVLIVLAAAGCTRDGLTPPVVETGPLKVELNTPNPDDGAILFTINGGPIDSLTAGSHQVYHAAVAGTSHRVIVRGSLAAGTLVQLWLPAGASRSAYSVTIQQVAARGSYAQRPLEGYTLTLTR